MQVKCYDQAKSNWNEPQGKFHTDEVLLNQVQPICLAKLNQLNFLKLPSQELPSFPPWFFFLLEYASWVKQRMSWLTVVRFWSMYTEKYVYWSCLGYNLKYKIQNQQKHKPWMVKVTCHSPNKKTKGRKKCVWLGHQIAPAFVSQEPILGLWAIHSMTCQCKAIKLRNW